MIAECRFVNGIGDFLNFWFFRLLWEFRREYKRGNLFKWEYEAWSVYGVEIGDHIFPFVPAWQRLLATRVSQIQILISPERNFCHIFCDADLIAGLYTVNTSIARARALATHQWPAYSSLFCFHVSSPASPNIVKAKKLRREPCPAKQPTFNELGNLTLDQPNFHTVGHPSSYSDHLLHHPSVFPFQRQSSESSILLHSIHALMEFKTYLKMWKILVFSQNIHQDKYWYIFSSHVTLTSPIASFQMFWYNHMPPPSWFQFRCKYKHNHLLSEPPWHLRSHFACQSRLWWHLQWM